MICYHAVAGGGKSNTLAAQDFPHIRGRPGSLAVFLLAAQGDCRLSADYYGGEVHD